MNSGTKDCGHEIAMATPSAGEAGATGEWRTLRPVMDSSKCLAVRRNDAVCQLCWVYCPDVCVSQAIPPKLDLAYCKGCGICAEVCPADALRMVPDDALRSDAPSSEALQHSPEVATLPSHASRDASNDAQSLTAGRHSTPASGEAENVPTIEVAIAVGGAR